MSQVHLLLFPTYFLMIQKSVGSRLFQTIFAKKNKKTEDILRGGDLSCAVFVSAILFLFGLVKERHATVDGTIKDMEASGWKKIRIPKPGAVILWEAALDQGEWHRHIGFAISKDQAMSNSSRRRVPVRHHLTFGTKSGKPKRKIEAMYWHPKLK